MRALAALVLVLVAGSTSALGPCSMAVAEAGKADDHGCCAKGLAAAPPACCHSQLTTPVAAILACRPTLSELPAVPCAPMAAATFATTASFASPATPHLHSPPVTILRI